MSVHHGGAAAIIVRPIVTHRQPEFVGLPCHLAVKAEFTHSGGGSADVCFFQSRVSNDQFSVIQHIVTDQTVDECRGFLPERLALRLDFGNCPVNAMRHGDVLSAQVFQKLDVMVARNGNGGAALHHVHYQTQHIGIAVSPVAEIAQKCRLSAVRMTVDAFDADIPQLCQQLFQFVAAAVNVSDDIEGAVPFSFVIPELGAHYLRVVDLFHRIEHIHIAEALTL